MEKEKNFDELAKKIPELNQKQNTFGKISSMFIDKFKVVYLIIFTLVLLGAMTYSAIPKESMPDISLNMVVVVTPYPGAAVEDIEKMITQPLEDNLDGIDKVTEITSTTTNGMSQVLVTFEDDMDMDDAQTKVNNEISSFNLPDGAMDPIVKVIETGEVPIMSMTLTGDYELSELKKYGLELEEEFQGVDGVKNVNLVGGHDREIQVILDFNKMLEYNINAGTVNNALKASNINIPAGSTDIDGKLLNIRVDETFKSVDEIENLIIKNSYAGTIFLKDVAEVRDHYKKPDSYSYIYLDGESAEDMVTPTIYLNVFREAGNDIIGPSDEMKRIIEEGKGVLYPSDVTIEITSDQSENVKDDLSTVVNNALGGLIVVIIVLFIFIGLREALIVSSVIPLSLLLSLLFMDYTGITLNMMSLTGFIIALGLLVDNAIVVMENIDRLREEGLDNTRASKFGLNQVGPAVFAATLTTVLAFLPVAMLPGMMGKFMSIMPKTVIFIIISSLIMSIVVTPTLCARFLPKFKEVKKKSFLSDKRKHRLASIFIFILSLLAFANEGEIVLTSVIAAVAFTSIYTIKSIIEEKNAASAKKGNNVASFSEKYKVFVYELLEQKKKKVLIYLGIVVVFIGSIATIPMGILDLELFPEEEASKYTVSIKAPVGTLLDDTRDIAFELEKKLYKYDEIKSFTVSVGDGDGEHTASLDVELYKKDETDLDVDYKRFENSLKSDVRDIAGATFEVSGQTSMSKMSSGKAVSLGIKGSNLDQIQEYADQYLEILSGIEGVDSPQTTTDGGISELRIDIDNNKAAYYGLSVSNVSSEIRSNISGIKSGIYKEDGEEYDISLYYSEDKISSIKDFDKLFFMNNQGELVNFNEIATIESSDGISQIDRQDGKKIIYIEADVKDGYNSNNIMKEFKKATKEVNLAEGYEAVEGGQAAQMSEQLRNMMISFAVAILLVYIVLVVQFNSMIQPVVILLSVPFALIGVVWGLIFTGNDLGFYAMFGIVALVGIAVNDAIVLIDYANYQRSIGLNRREAISEAVKTRFIPVFATSLTTIGGVLPLALYNDSFSQLGWAIISGLLVATVLTLLIIPMTYYGLDGSAERISKKLGLFQER